MKAGMITVWVCTVLTCVVGCHAPPGPKAASPPPASALPGALRIATHLPADTAALVVASDPQDLLDRLGRQQVADQFREAHERLVAELIVNVDHDLSGPAGLREVGIDPRGAAGVAWLGPVKEVAVVFITVTEPERFKAAVYRAGRARDVPVEPSVVADRVVLRPRGEQDDLALLLIDGLALFVLPQGNTEASTVARDLARLATEQSLASHDPFQQAMAGLTPGSDLWAYVDVAPTLRQLVGLDPRWGGDSFALASAELERRWSLELALARGRGVAAAELVAIDERFRAARRDLRSDEAATRYRRVIGSLGPAALGLEVLPNGVRARGRLLLHPGTVFDRLLRSRGTPPALASRLRERPAFLMQCSVDVATATQVAGALLGSTKPLERTLGLEEVAELAAVFDGEVGIALHHPLRFDDKAKKVPTLQLSALLGLVDEARARALLEKLSEHPELGDELQRTGKGAYRVSLGELGKVEVSVQGRMLMVTSDSSRLRGGDREAKSSWAGTGHGLMRRFALSRGSAFDVAGLLGLWWMTEYGQHGTADTPAAARSEEAGAGGDETVSRLQEELAELDVRIERQSAGMARRSLKRQLSLARRLGAVAVRASRGDLGLELEAGWVVGDESLPDLVTTLAREALRHEEPRSDDELRWALVQDLMDRRDRLQGELDEARESSGGEARPNAAPALEPAAPETEAHP